MNFTAKSFPSLRAITHQMAKNAPSGITAKNLWEIVGYTNYQTMMSELSGQPGHKLGVDMLLPLMDAAESDAPVKFLAEEREGVFFKLPRLLVAQNKCMTLQLAHTLKETGEAATLAAAHIIDGVVTKDEFINFKKENREAIAALLALEKLMEEAVEG